MNRHSFITLTAPSSMGTAAQSLRWVRNDGSVVDIVPSSARPASSAAFATDTENAPQTFQLKVGYPAAASVTGSDMDPNAVRWYMQTIGKWLDHGNMSGALKTEGFSDKRALVSVVDDHTPGIEEPVCFDVIKVQDEPKSRA